MGIKKILILVQDSKVGDKIEQAFYRSEFDVLRTDDPNHAVRLLLKENPHAMIVDWDLANGSLDNIKEVMRENCRKTALILLAKHKKTEDRIHALEEGADACISQPPEIEELLAKVKALVRRIEMVDQAPKSIRIKDIEINLDTHEVKKNGKYVDLTYTQFKLLYLLASRREYVFSRDEILKTVWGENAYVTDRTVDVHVKRLREKLGELKHPSRYIQTIHGLGYRFA